MGCTKYFKFSVVSFYREKGKLYAYTENEHESLTLAKDYVVKITDGI